VDFAGSTSGHFNRVVHDGHNLVSPSRQENNQHDEDNHFPDCLKLGVPASMMRDGRGNHPPVMSKKATGVSNV